MYNEGDVVVICSPHYYRTITQKYCYDDSPIGDYQGIHCIIKEVIKYFEGLQTSYRVTPIEKRESKYGNLPVENYTWNEDALLPIRSDNYSGLIESFNCFAAKREAENNEVNKEEYLSLLDEE